VRFDRFEIDAFGPLHGFRAEGLAGHPLLVVQGENESGKTSLREFLATLLYGFATADRDGFRHAPWSGAAPEGRALLRLSDGRALSVERRLRDAPEGRLASDDGAPSELGNRPLPATGTLAREAFDDVHAPRAAEGLRDATWALVRERLLGGQSVPHLRSAREAAAALEARAAELWQPGRRARTRQRHLSVRLRRLSRLRDRAAAELRRQTELRTQVAAKAWHATGMQEQLAEARARLLRAERLLPVVRGLAAAAELRRRARAAVAQDGFPDDVRARLAALRAATRAADERCAALAAEVAGHEQRAALSLQDQSLLAAEEEIRALVGEAAVHHQDLVHANDLTREHDAQDALFRERGSALFARPLDTAGRDSLARLGMVELRARVQACEDAARGPELAREELRQSREALRACELDFEAIPSADSERRLRAREDLLRQLQAREDALQALRHAVETARAAREAAQKQRVRKPSPARSRAIGQFAAAGGTLATLAFGAASAWWLVVPVAGGLLFSGWRALRVRAEAPDGPSDESRAEAVRQECLKLREQLQLHEFETVASHLDKAQQSLAHVAQRPELERRLVQARQRTEECARRVQQREQEHDKARARVGEWLAALPLLPARLEQPGQDLLHDLDELRAALREMTRLVGERQAVAERAREREARAARLAGTLETVTLRSPMDAAALWQERLQLALAARRRAEESGRVLPALREQARELEAARNESHSAQRACEDALAALDTQRRPEAGLRVLEESRAWLSEADQAEAAVRCQFPDWAERSAEATQASGHGEELDLSTAQRVALEDQIAALQDGLSRLREELEAMGRERAALAARRPLSDIDGELVALTDERTRVERRRDRLAALAALLRLADERWRQRWQAPLLAAASTHLAALTGGRWERISAESGPDGTRLFLKPRDGESLHELAAPLSGAVRSQAWFALRLSLAEQLDGDEPLPLLLDDPFAGWDAERVRQAAGLLAAAGSRRQVILLCGQPDVAELLEAQVKAHVLRLPAPSGAPRARRRDESRKGRDEARKDEPRREEKPRASV